METIMETTVSEEETAVPVAVEPPKKKGRKKAAKAEATTMDLAVVVKPPRRTKVSANKTAEPKKVIDKSLKAKFRAKLREIDIEKLKKPWMAQKSFRLITTAEGLTQYVDDTLSDTSCWQQVYVDGPMTPVVAVDTETYGLDTRVMVEFKETTDTEGNRVWEPVYELNIEIAGVCLSRDGFCGVYIPLFHEDGQNIPIEVVNAELQRLFDRAHLVFYHAKFDREVMRQTLNIRFRPYPHYEDVQALKFSNDPKAEMGDDTFTGGAEGLKGLALTDLDTPLEMIELSEIGKVKAPLELTDQEKDEEALQTTWVKCHKADTTLCECGDKAVWLRQEAVEGVDGRAVFNADGSKETKDTGECLKGSCLTRPSDATRKVKGQRMQYVPFTWVPTPIALWYAAADAICTWLLWAKLHLDARERKLVHAIDGQLCDSLAWMERQRFLIDTERHARLVRWNNEENVKRQENLCQLAVAAGWKDKRYDEDNKVIEETPFKIASPVDMPRLLFEIKGFKCTKYTDKGKQSCDAEVLEDLLKLHPHDTFLNALVEYKKYVSLHPENLAWDKRDKTSRIYLKQATVAGGRLAASGGKFDRDGGISVNIQAVKTVGGNWWVKGNVLTPDHVDEADVEEHAEHELDKSCFKEIGRAAVRNDSGVVILADDPGYAAAAEKYGYSMRDGKWVVKAPGIIKNHIANYLGYAICLVPGCTSCSEKHGILIPKSRLDANQIINLRALFIAPAGWTFFSSDYQNIEMRVAANISGEPAFIREFLEGTGDFHSLTASDVFPEFTNPNTTKARKKELRSLAKIMNFALLYGGTEYTIYENLKKEMPDITREMAREMVAAYWAKVSTFREWCDGMQRTAKEELTCTTPTGRIIKFMSAMKRRGIAKPSDSELNTYFKWIKLRKKYRAFEAQAEDPLTPLSDSQKDAASAIQTQMDSLYDDPAIRKAIDYNKFMSEIGRVSVNAPLQGLAGDFMRMAINRLYMLFTQHEPLAQSVLRVHCSVHDEIDYSVKNAYVPFIVPRLTREMKLRKIHARRQWPVPIGADTEYGDSWDVSYHLTGDSDNKPSGWTDIPGLEEYLPAEFDRPYVENLCQGLIGNDLVFKGHVKEEFKALHPAAVEVSHHVLEAKEPAMVRKLLFAVLQLHEYWTVDGTPDEDTTKMETFLEYERRRGLTADDRDPMPPEGWLCSLPFDRIKRKPIPILGPDPGAGGSEPQPEPAPPAPPEPNSQMGFDFTAPVEEAVAPAEEPALEPPVVEMESIPSAQEPLAEDLGEPPVVNAPEEKEEPPMIDNDPCQEDNLFREVKKRPVRPTAPPAAGPIVATGQPGRPGLKTPILKDLDSLTFERLLTHLGYPDGKITMAISYKGEITHLKRVAHTSIPFKYLTTE